MTRFCTSLIALITAQIFQVAHAQNAQRVFEIASPSVLVVKTPTSQGSGVIFGVKRSGLTPTTGILTNCHVVQGHRQVTVERLGKQSSATVLTCDSDRDMALLEIGGELPAAQRRTTPLKVGEPVYAIGAPRGLELSISEGIVSQLRATDLGKDPLIQTTAAISPGSSGGGLFDAEGRLVGLTTMSRKESQSLNFAMPWGFFSSIRNTDNVRAAPAPNPIAVPRPPPPSPSVPNPDSGLIANRYQVLGNGSAIKDIQTNLIWQRCSVGQTWNGNTCEGEARRFTFDQAQQLSSNGWRVPTVRELASLIYCSSGSRTHADIGDGGPQIAYYCNDNNYGLPTLQTAAFPRSNRNTYWTTSPYEGSAASYAWVVNFGNGGVNVNYGINSRNDNYYVRLVR